MTNITTDNTTDEHYHAVAESWRSKNKTTAKEFFVIDADRHAMGAKAVWRRPNVMNGVHYWEESWDPVWKTMIDLGMALLFHEATGTYNVSYSTDYKYDRYWLAHVVSHPCEMATGMCGLIGYGVLERHPDLQVLFCEAGAT